MAVRHFCSRCGDSLLSIINKLCNVTGVLHTCIYTARFYRTNSGRIYISRENQHKYMFNENKAIVDLEHPLCLALATI